MKIGKGPLNRRESGRQIKKPRRELPDEQGNVSDASVSFDASLVCGTFSLSTNSLFSILTNNPHYSFRNR